MTNITIALAGNPNCGKTALFNALTGSRQRVGNWSGVTVDKKTGRFSHGSQEFSLVDLPGTYSISVVSEGSIDEKIACEYLLSQKADVLINVLDASNLERNLYLTQQLLEMGIPTVLAVNMMDVVEKRGITLNLKQLSKKLNCPVVGLVATRQIGFDALKSAVADVLKKKPKPFELGLDKPLESAIDKLSDAMAGDFIETKYRRWLARRLLENDYLAQQTAGEKWVKAAGQVAEVIEMLLDEEPDILIADARYRFAGSVVNTITRFKKTNRQTMTERLDKFVLNRYAGIPFFFFVMYLMFVFAINVGGAFQDFFDIGGSTIFVGGLAHLLSAWHFPNWSIAILANGVGVGINTVLTFIPVIGAMFLFLAFLEDCGYMARAAFVMDRLMRALGLPGKSFVPMIVGFGCNVPAVMGARTLSNPRDRIITIMMMPFMSCGARLAIFTVFASAFFPSGGATIIFFLYILGIVVAVLTGLVLRRTILKGQSESMVMELPPYHLPYTSSLFRHAWYRLKSFITRAGRVILPVCIIIGVLNSISITGGAVHYGQQSLLSATGRIVTPVFSPMGLSQDNWPATVGLVTGVLAKEVVVGTLNTLYSEVAHVKLDEEQFSFLGGLRDAVMSVPKNLMALKTAIFNPIAASEAPHDMNKAAYGLMYQRFDGKVGAFAYLLFVLLYFPCISTMAAIQREVNRRWAYFSVVWSTGIAYSLSVICYQSLTVFRHPISSLSWVGAMILLLILGVLGMKRYAQQPPAVGKLVTSEG
jgi:ferrous iron transport protein B